jgi:type II secretory pathway pseudopilin PulG
MTLSNYKGKKTQQGIGIVEILLGVALIGIAAVFVYVNATKATQNTANKQLTDEVVLIKSAGRAWRGVLPHYTGVSIAVMVDNGLLNSSWGSGTSINPAGGNYTVTVSGTDATAMVLTVTGMEDEQCAGVARTLDPSAASGTTSSCTSGTLSITFR